MRIYEFSKLYNIPTREIINHLSSVGISVTSHMAMLSDAAVGILEKKFLTKSSEGPKQGVVSKQTDSLHDAPLVSCATKIDREALPEIRNDQSSSAAQSMPILLESMRVADLAEKLDKPASEIIVLLLRWGIIAAKNQLISEQFVARVLSHFGVSTASRDQAKAQEISKDGRLEKISGSEYRSPIVVVIGHVDHGKTTLLDYIRKTRVASREKGGITQHIGAYEVETPHGKVVFVDTPGHETFSKMRKRGIRVADLAVLVVAADDGVMDQTVEALEYARSMEVPIIVAINKIDKVDKTRVAAIKRILSQQYGLVSDEWGGDTMMLPLSAKTGEGVDKFLEMLVLQAEVMDLRAHLGLPAQGYVLESKFERGHGPVATIICQQGILKIGDYFACGSTTGKVNAMINSHGQRISKLTVSVPGVVAGFSTLPEAGDLFRVISKEEYKKARDGHLIREGGSSGKSIQGLFVDENQKENGPRVIFKTDTNSSR